MTEDGGGASRTTEPAAGTSSSTDVSLREYLTQRIDAVEQRSEARFAATQQAVDIALAATERRFEGVNEFRAALSDQAAHFVTRETLSAEISKGAASIKAIREERTTQDKENERRFQRTETFQTRLGTVAAVIAVIGVANLVKLWFG